MSATSGLANTPTLPAGSSSSGFSLRCYCLAPAGPADKSITGATTDLELMSHSSGRAAWRAAGDATDTSPCRLISGDMMGAQWAQVCLFRVTQEHIELSCFLLAGYPSRPSDSEPCLEGFWRYHPAQTLPSAHFFCPTSYTCPQIAMMGTQQVGSLGDLLALEICGASQGAVPGLALTCGHPGRYRSFSFSPHLPCAHSLLAPARDWCLLKHQHKRIPSPLSWGR